MSIYIKGLDLPHKGQERHHISISDEGLVIIGGRYTIYRAIEVPSHGQPIVLPCKAGDTVYWNTGLDIVEARVADFIIDGAMQLRLNLPTLDITPVYPHDRLFLTREEAEAALEEADWPTVDPSLGGNFRRPKV